MDQLPVTLTIAGAAALVNLWLAWRVAQVRLREGVAFGDAGNHHVICRMRAHANFAEYTPFVLILLALIELAQGASLWLWSIGGSYLLARLAHGLGMDRPAPNPLRLAGTIVTFLTLLGLGVWAIAIPYLDRAAPFVSNVA